MILVRNVFKVQFGKSKDAVAAWKEAMEVGKRIGFPVKSSRLMTDLVGDFYTIVFENEFASMAEFESAGPKIMSNPEWAAAYAKVSALTESGYREIFNIIPL